MRRRLVGLGLARNAAQGRVECVFPGLEGTPPLGGVPVGDERGPLLHDLAPLVEQENCPMLSEHERKG